MNEPTQPTEEQIMNALVIQKIGQQTLELLSCQAKLQVVSQKQAAFEALVNQAAAAKSPTNAPATAPVAGV